MANDIQNCSELDNQTTTLDQIWEKQKTETKENIRPHHAAVWRVFARWNGHWRPILR